MEKNGFSCIAVENAGRCSFMSAGEIWVTIRPATPLWGQCQQEIKTQSQKFSPWPARVTVRKSQRTETTQCLLAVKFQKEMWRTSEVNTVQHRTKLWYLLQWGGVLRNPSNVPGANVTWYMIPFLCHVLKIQVPGDRKHRATGKGVGLIANEFFSEFG